MSTYPRLFRKVLRFSATGLAVTLLHVLIVMLMVNTFTLSAPISNGLAFALATSVSYLVNTSWSFSARLHGRTLVRFTLVSLVGLCLSVGISWWAQLAGYNYLIGITCVVLTVPAVTFLLHNTWTYR